VDAVTADFNNDGHLDLATASNSGGTVSVLLGDDYGGFGAASQFAAGASPSSLAVGDFNGDGKLDLVTADQSLRYVSALLGNGDGTFRPPVTTDTTYKFAGKPVLMAVVDHAGGTSELAFATHAVPFDYESVNEAAYVELLGSDGQGRFVGPSSRFFSGNGVPVGLAVADLNANGNPDWVTVNDFYDNSTGSYYGEVAVFQWGSGTYVYETSPGPQGVAVGDFTGDGLPDLIINGQTREVRPGLGGGGFGSPISNPPGGWVDAVADFNGDGRFDIHSWGSVLLSLGDGTFTEPIGSTGNARAVGDFNGDGRMDVAALGSSAVLVSLNDGVWPPLSPTPPWVRTGDATVTEGNSGTVEARFTVTLSWASSETITVAYATGDVSGIGNGSAVAGSDYQGASGTLNFAPGETSKTVTVLVNGDREGELNESFSVNLGDPTNAVIMDGQGVGTIMDDEPRITTNYAMSRSEGNTGQMPFVFAVSLSSAYDAPVTVDWTTANGSATAGSDYRAASGTLTIPAGQTTGTITILVNGDRLAEANETFYVNLSGATNALIIYGYSTGTIVDDEPRISISDVTRYEGNGKKTTLFVFTVTLSSAYDQAVTTSFRTVNGTATTSDGDYIAKTGTLTFAPGETTKTITIEVKGDNKKEANETFYLDLFGNSSNSLFTKNRGIGTILNDD
jgi:hypothetical protein